jgi:PAS domain S-box-containing protein
LEGVVSTSFSVNDSTKSLIYRYGLAVVLVGIALGIKLFLLQFKVSFPLSSSFLAAIAISFWFGGTGPGVLAVLLSSVVFGFVVIPYQIQIMGGSHQGSFITTLLYLGYFGFVALLMSWFSSSRRKAERELNQARDQLEAMIEERTGDLQQTNIELHSEVAERKRAEANLRETAQLLDLTHDSVFVRDMQNVITYWNRGAEVQYGWTRDEAIGQVSHEIAKTIFPSSLPEIMEDLERSGRWEGELIHTRRDGQQIMVASRWALQSDDQGNSISILETNNDITQRREAEEALQKARAELAHATRVMTMGELVASIAHEVNQPLGAIVANGHACVRLLSREEPDIQKSREVAERMINDGMRASEVIKRIRELLNKTNPAMEPLSINEIIQEVIALASRDLLRSRIRLTTQLAENLPSIIGDRIQLQQVILNLVLNARDALSGVPAEQRELVIASESMDGELVVSVRDSGVGLHSKDLEQIFEPFFTTKAEGMGLGLSISRRIIEAHDGMLWATQNVAKGTTVQFKLPARIE